MKKPFTDRETKSIFERAARGFAKDLKEHMEYAKFVEEQPDDVKFVCLQPVGKVDRIFAAKMLKDRIEHDRRMMCGLYEMLDKVKQWEEEQFFEGMKQFFKGEKGQRVASKTIV